LVAEDRGPVRAGTRRADGTWSTFADVQTSHGPINSVQHIDTQTYDFYVSDRRIRHLVAKTVVGGLFYGRSVGATSLPWYDIEVLAGERGTIEDVSCADLPEDPVSLQVCATAGGQLWNSLRYAEYPLIPSGSWTPFGDVESGLGERGYLYRVACRFVANILHVCAVSREGGLWYTTRQSSGNWAPFVDVNQQAGTPGDRLVDVAISG
jgi:hypothetical protein